MAVPSNLFTTGTYAASVSFNRGTFVQLNAIAAPKYAAQQGFPAPAWDNGGPSTGKIGPGPNTVQLQSSGYILPVLTIQVPNISPGSIQTYLIWALDLNTLNATLGLMVLNAGTIIIYQQVQGTATSVS